MKGIIDRFEEDFAIIELESMKILSVEKIKIPQEAEEGDVLDIGSTITINYKETEKRKKQIDELSNDLWK